MNTKDFEHYYDFSKIEAAINEGKPFEFELIGPSEASRNFIQKAIQLYLQQINRENIHNLVCLCMEEIISNSVKANLKRAYFIHNELDINNHEHYEAGMKTFREMGLSKARQLEFIETTQDLGFYVKVRFEVADNILIITTRNNSLISTEELERIRNKLNMSENKSSEDLFMNSVDMTEGCGLGIIMIKKIMGQVSSLKDGFSIYADDKDTVTELRIDMK